MKPSKKAIEVACEEHHKFSYPTDERPMRAILEAAYAIDVDPMMAELEEKDARKTFRRIENECEIDRLKEEVEGLRFDIERGLTLMSEQVAEIAFLKRNSESLDTVLDEKNKEIERLQDRLAVLKAPV